MRRGSLLTLLSVCFSALLTTGDEPSPIDLAKVRGIVLGESGQPAAGAAVTVISESFEPPQASTDRQGRFTLQLEPRQTRNLKLLASSEGGRQQGLFLYTRPSVQNVEAIDSPPKWQSLDDISIKLAAAREIKVRVVDAEQRPVVGATTRACIFGGGLIAKQSDADGRATLLAPAGAELFAVYAMKPKVGLDYFAFQQPRREDRKEGVLEQDHAEPVTLTLRGVQPLRMRVVDDQDRPVAGVRVNPYYVELPDKGWPLVTTWHWVLTGDDGVAHFDALPVGSSPLSTVWAQKRRYSMPELCPFDPAKDKEVTARLLQQQQLRGQVLRADGKPAAAAVVTVLGDGSTDYHFERKVSCDAAGRFELHVDANKAYIALAEQEKDCSAAQLSVCKAGQEPKPLELRLEPATRVFGTLHGVKDAQPIAGHAIHLLLYEKEIYDALPAEERSPKDPRTRQIYFELARTAVTDERGNFDFFAGRGTHYLRSHNVSSSKLDLSGQKEFELQLTTKEPPQSQLSGRVVHASHPSRPVPHALVGLAGLSAWCDEQGRFSFKRGEVAARLFAQSEDLLFASFMEVGAEDKEVTIPIQPAASARGRIVNKATGKPVPWFDLQYGIKITLGPPPNHLYQMHYADEVSTDGEGRFVVSGLVPGETYSLQTIVSRMANGQGGGWRDIGTIQPDRATLVELGDIAISDDIPVPSLDRQIAWALQLRPAARHGVLGLSLENRVKEKVHEENLAERPVLLVLTTPSSKHGRQFFEAYFAAEDKPSKLAAAAHRYALLGIDTGNDIRGDERAAGLKGLGIAPPAADDVTFAILDREGKVAATTTSLDLLDSEQLSIARVAEFLEKHLSVLPDADKEYADALAAAKRDDKRVLVFTTDPSCAPCLLLTRYFHEHQELLSKDYVVARLDERYPNSADVIKRIRGTQKSSPWMAILDAEDKTLITSQGTFGNIGFPNEPEGIEHFETMLTSTAKQLTKEEIGKLIEALGDPSPPR